MSLSKATCLWVVVAAVLGTLGCNSYRYVRDTTPQLEQMRHEYVRNNPGNRFNDAILEGRVQPGMSRLQVRVAWGEPDQVAAGDRLGVDQTWAYAEQEPSRGSSVYQLRFGGEILRAVEVSRNALVLSADHADSKPATPVPVEQGSTTTKRFQ